MGDRGDDSMFVDSPSTSDDPSSRTERTEFGKTKYANPFIF